LPDPDSPNDAERLAALDAVGEVADRLHQAVVGGELDGEVLHHQEGSFGSAGAAMPSGRSLISVLIPHLTRGSRKL